MTATLFPKTVSKTLLSLFIFNRKIINSVKIPPCASSVKILKEKKKIQNEQSNSKVENQPTQPWRKTKNDKKTNSTPLMQHRKLKTNKHESLKKNGMISGASEVK